MYNFVAIFGLLFATPIYGSTETDVTHVDESAISGFGSDSDYDYNYLYEDVDQIFTNKTTISPNGEFFRLHPGLYISIENLYYSQAQSWNETTFPNLQITSDARYFVPSF